MYIIQIVSQSLLSLSLLERNVPTTMATMPIQENFVSRIAHTKLENEILSSGSLEITLVKGQTIITDQICISMALTMSPKKYFKGKWLVHFLVSIRQSAASHQTVDPYVILAG